MYIKISKKSQIILLRDINPFLKKYKIPKEVLHEIENVLNFECNSKFDYIALFLKPLKRDTTDVLEELKIYPETYEVPDDNIIEISVKGNKHPMKKNRIWSRYNILLPQTKRQIFVIYSMKKKNLYKRGTF